MNSQIQSTLAAAARAERVIPLDHPALAGHFPDNPIVPGVVLLAAVVAVITASLLPDSRLDSVANCKFTAMVRPAEQFIIEAVVDSDADSVNAAPTSRRVRFTIQGLNASIANGTLNFALDK